MTDTLPMRLAKQLEQAVYDGKFQPGDRINEAALAAEMGMSRGPIREAIRILTGYGLVVAVPHKGVFVRQLSVREIAEISDLRALVFGFAAGLAAENRTREGCERLAAILDRMDGAAEDGDRNEYFHANLEFHGAVVAMAASKRAQRLYSDLVKELHVLRREDFNNSGNMRKSNIEHRKVYEGILTGDREAAQKAAEAHILAGCQRMIRTFEALYAARDEADVSRQPTQKGQRRSSAGRRR